MSSQMHTNGLNYYKSYPIPQISSFLFTFGVQTEILSHLERTFKMAPQTSSRYSSNSPPIMSNTCQHYDDLSMIYKIILPRRSVIKIYCSFKTVNQTSHIIGKGEENIKIFSPFSYVRKRLNFTEK